MNYTLQFAEEVELDLDEIKLWYNSQQRELYDKFELSFEECLSRILRLPLIGEELAPGIRRRPIKRYPYFVLYRTKEEVVEVLGVFHFKQDPSRYEERFSKNGH